MNPAVIRCLATVHIIQVIISKFCDWASSWIVSVSFGHETWCKRPVETLLFVASLHSTSTSWISFPGGQWPNPRQGVSTHRWQTWVQKASARVAWHPGSLFVKAGGVNPCMSTTFLYIFLLWWLNRGVTGLVLTTKVDIQWRYHWERLGDTKSASVSECELLPFHIFILFRQIDSDFIPQKGGQRIQVLEWLDFNKVPGFVASSCFPPKRIQSQVVALQPSKRCLALDPCKSLPNFWSSWELPRWGWNAHDKYC